jgi:prepilin-type processing-associated H-X9-DG protein
MHKCGYVHRDVSTGNILFCDGRGILMDLEYAKLMGAEKKPREPITVRGIVSVYLEAFFANN